MQNENAGVSCGVHEGSENPLREEEENWSVSGRDVGQRQWGNENGNGSGADDDGDDCGLSVRETESGACVHFPIPHHHHPHDRRDRDRVTTTGPVNLSGLALLLFGWRTNARSALPHFLRRAWQSVKRRTRSAKMTWAMMVRMMWSVYGLQSPESMR